MLQATPLWSLMHSPGRLLCPPPPFLNRQPSPYNFRPTSTPATQLLSHYRQPSAPLPSRRLPAWRRRCRPPLSSPSTLPPSQLPKKDGQTSSLCRRHPPYASSPSQWGRRDISTGVRSLHDVHHPGVRATTRLVKAAFCWPKMGKDITAFAQSCLGCQRGKIHHHISLQPEVIAIPQRRFSHILYMWT
jgi:hypothetical protein